MVRSAFELVTNESASFAASPFLPTDPRREYVTPYSFLSSTRTLPVNSDDITRNLNSGIYSQMRCDPELAKCITLLVIGALGDGYTLIPAFPEKATPSSEETKRYEKAVEIRDHCARSLAGPKKAVRQTWEDQLTGALCYGNKVAEKIWKVAKGGKDDGKLVLDMLKCKPRDAVRFVVDPFFNVLGLIDANSWADNFDPVVGAASLIPLNKFQITETQQGMITLNGNPIIPREKFAVLSLQSENEDPRGRSILRPAFNSWHLKKETFPQFLRYLLLTALPLLIGILPEKEEGKQVLRDKQGNYVTDNEGRYVEVSPTEAFASELLKLRDGSVMAAKGGSTIKLVEAKGDGSAFHKAFELFNKEMEMSILLQTLATSDAKYNTRAASVTHMTVLDQKIWWLKGCMIDMITEDLLKPMVSYNFGDDMLEYVPLIHFGDTERRDFAPDGQTIAALMRANYFDPSQMKGLDQQLGVPVRDVSLADLQKKMDLLLQASKPNGATQLPNGAVSNPAPRKVTSTAKFPKTGPSPTA